VSGIGRGVGLSGAWWGGCVHFGRGGVGWGRGGGVGGGGGGEGGGRGGGGVGMGGGVGVRLNLAGTLHCASHTNKLHHALGITHE